MNITEKTKLLEYKLPHVWKKTPSCGWCFAGFTIKTRKINHRPILLDCGHNICERCLHTQRTNSFKCKECDLIIYKQQILKEQNFDTNFYLWGLLSYIEYKLPYDLGHVQAKCEQNSWNIGKYDCSECSEFRTNFVCMQCGVPYCKSCFRLVHQSSNVLKRHNLQLCDSSSLYIDKPKKCHKHRCNHTAFCLNCNETTCSECRDTEHCGHKVKSIYDENKKMLSRVVSSIETIKSAEEYASQAQKDIKYMEKKQKEYALESIESVSKYFLHIHGLLQNEERKILLEIQGHIMTMMEKSKRCSAKLDSSLETLEASRFKLEQITAVTPNDIMLSRLIEQTNTILEKTPCNVDLSAVDENPFKIGFQKCAEEITQDLVQVELNKNYFKEKFYTFFDGNTSSNTSESASLPCQEQHASKPKRSNVEYEKSTKKQNFQNKTKTFHGRGGGSARVNQTASRALSISSDKSELKIATKKVHVSHIRNPNEFYVQKQLFVSACSDFQNYCSTEGELANTPDYIEIGSMYLVKPLNETNWFRGNVIAENSTSTYRVFLIDFGETIEVPSQSFRVICEDLARRIPATIRCEIYSIRPFQTNWTNAATQLMTEILENSIVNMQTLKTLPDQTELVDIIVHQKSNVISIRDALIFTGLAEQDIIDDELSGSVKAAIEIKEKAIQTFSQEFCKSSIKEGDLFSASIVNMVDPSEFYVIKNDQKREVELLTENLNEFYKNNKLEKIYVPRIGMICTVLIEDNWYRVRIVETSEKVYCKVWLVDIGVYKTVSWKQLNVLNDKFLTINETVVRCSLIDIQPLHANNYIWTSEAIVEFGLVTENNSLQVTVHVIDGQDLLVVLSVIKPKFDVNVNAWLVKKNHAISTGILSIKAEFYKQKEFEISDMDVNLCVDEIEDAFAEPYGKRDSQLKVRVVNIISPGEFYVKIIKYAATIEKFHHTVQMMMEKQLADAEDQTMVHAIRWCRDDKCMATVRIKEDYPVQWYRAIVREVVIKDTAARYSLLLRDHGLIIGDVAAQHLFPIDPTMDRLFNCAIQCHLACVAPTGGLETWSSSSTDELKLLLGSFEAIGITTHGDRVNNSNPVILWGYNTECVDPLMPTTYKWSNINKLLVHRGFVHLVDKFIIDEQQTLESKTAIDGRQDNTLCSELEQLLNEFIENNQNGKPLPFGDDYAPSTFDYSDNESECIVDETENKLTWLPALQIEKTIFVAIPTAISEDGTIYLHDYEQAPLLTKIKRKISMALKNDEPKLTQTFWYAGQSCLARYHLDKSYYRACITELSEDKKSATVLFVDYGNSEEIDLCDLKKQIVCKKIPCQANKFKIFGIRPLNGASTWPSECLDFIHSQLVEKLCTVRVEEDQKNNEVKECDISFNNCNMRQMLLQRGFAETITTIKYPILEEMIVTDNNDKEDIIILENDSDVEEEPFDIDENYRKLFEKLDLNNLYEKCERAGGCSSNESNKFDSKLEPIYDYKQPIKSQCRSPERRRAESTSPNEENEEFLTRFTPLTIPNNIDGFYCEILRIMGTNRVYVRPILDYLEEKCAELSRKIQLAAQTATKLTNFDTNTTCLAKFSEDGLWYRAVVRQFNSDSVCVDVLFVDYLNTEVLEPRKVRKCPDFLLEFPLQNVLLKLSGIQANRRLRKADVKRKLAESLANKIFYAKITNKSFPLEVNLYVTETSSQLVYEKLIQEKFYVWNNTQ